MPGSRKDAVVGVRPSWLRGIVQELQRVTGKTLLADLGETHTALKDFARALSPPDNHTELVVLRGLLLELAHRMGADLHARAHRAVPEATCEVNPSAVIEQFWRAPGEPPQEAFLRWNDAFFVWLAQTHAQSPASRAARLLRDHCQQAWTASTLAGVLHTTSSRLTRQFRAEWGMSIGDYHRTARVLRGLKCVRDEKVETVANRVGFKSKKRNPARARVPGSRP